MLKARYFTHTLEFTRPAGTSRGSLHQKPAWYIRLEDKEGRAGWGEVGFIPGLSLEDPRDMDLRLDHLCKLINRGEMDPRQELPAQPGARFALDTALRDLEGGGRRLLFESAFSRGKQGIPTNGLIWMGEKDYLLEQIRQKSQEGYRVLKMKVGALDFRTEVELLDQLRSQFDEQALELRLDANGAWSAAEALPRLFALSAFRIHSLEQPIAAGQPGEMARICASSPIPIALDEELIGIHGEKAKGELLEAIKPSYIILKPGLMGGLHAADQWIEVAGEKGVHWWATSALESNLGLNAIAQWVAAKGPSLPQGLGTGMLYHNNLPSPLELRGDELWHGPGPWGLQLLEAQEGRA